MSKVIQEDELILRKTAIVGKKGAKSKQSKAKKTKKKIVPMLTGLSLDMHGISPYTIRLKSEGAKKSLCLAVCLTSKILWDPELQEIWAYKENPPSPRDGEYAGYYEERFFDVQPMEPRLHQINPRRLQACMFTAELAQDWEGGQK